jgi:hypothetical protein
VSDESEKVGRRGPVRQRPPVEYKQWVVVRRVRDPHGGTLTEMDCRTGSPIGCHTGILLDVERRSLFHDDDLAQCTDEINACLEKQRSMNKDKNRELSIISTPMGLMLAWVKCGDKLPAVESKDEIIRVDYNDPDEVAEILGLI